MGLRLRDTDYFLPFWLGPTAAGALQEFIDIDVTAGDLVRLLQANRPYQDLFANFVEKKIGRRGEDTDPTSPAKPRTTTYRLVGLLGLVGSRNLLLSIRLNEAIHGTIPLDDKGAFTGKPSNLLKYALRAEDFFQRNDLEYPETAFAGGLLFDWIAAFAAKKESGKRLQPFLDETWKLTLRTALAAYELGRRVPGQAPKQILAGAFFLHAGRLLQAEATEAYADFLRTQEADKHLDPLARLTLERESFGFSAEEISAYLLNFFSLFQELRPAIRHYREPFVLKARDGAAYREANLLLLADALARSWKLPNGEADPVWDHWAPAARKALGLDKTTIEAALQAAFAPR